MATENRNPPESVLLAVTSFLFVTTSLFTAVRCWAKSSQRLWSYFDAVFATGFLACAAQCTTVFLAVAQYGFGLNTVEEAILADSRWLESLYASDLLYVISIGMSRCSTAFFLSTLTRAKRQSAVGMAIASGASIWTVASSFLIAIRGDLKQPWQTLEPPSMRWVGIEASGLVLELACWAFSASLVWTLNMPLIRRLRLIFVFALRLLLAPFIVARLISLSPASFERTINGLVSVQVFTQTAMHFALVAECLTCLRPFMQTFHEGLAPGNANSYWGGLSHVSQLGVSGSSGTDNDLKKHIRVTAQQIPDGVAGDTGKRRRYKNGNADMHLRSDPTGFSTRCESKRDRDDMWAGGGEDDIELLSTTRSIHVRQTMVMSVSSQ